MDAILAAARRGTDQIEADPTLLSQQGADPHGEASRLSKWYGLVVCGQGG